MNARFEWSRLPTVLPTFLYRLETADVGRLAASISCGQEIAGNGVFTLGMIAEFEEPLRTVGAWLYRDCFGKQD
jgi:hypothetical protein